MVVYFVCFLYKFVRQWICNVSSLSISTVPLQDISPRRISLHLCGPQCTTSVAIRRQDADYNVEGLGPMTSNGIQYEPWNDR